MLTSLRPKFGDLFSSRDFLPAKISVLSAQNAFSKELEDKKVKIFICQWDTIPS